jgi:hypothetical protein
MLGNILSTFQLFRMQADPALHRIQHTLFCQPGDPTAAGFLLGALGTHHTATACGCGAVADVADPFRALKTERQAFAGRAEVAIVAADIAEIILGEEALLFVPGCVGLGNPRRDAHLEAGGHFLSIVIPGIRQHIELLDAQDLLGPQTHILQMTLVGETVGDLMVDNEHVLAVDGHLYVVGDLGMMAPSDGHGAGIRIGKRDLRLTGFVHLLVDTFQVLFPVL